MSWQDRQQTKTSKSELSTELATVIANAAGTATPVVVFEDFTGGAEWVPSTVVDYTGAGILQSITFILQSSASASAVAPEKVYLNLSIDGVNVVDSNDIFSIICASSITSVSIPLNIPFSTSLCVQYGWASDYTLDGVSIVVVYTHS